MVLPWQLDTVRQNSTLQEGWVLSRNLQLPPIVTRSPDTVLALSVKGPWFISSCRAITEGSYGWFVSVKIHSKKKKKYTFPGDLFAFQATKKMCSGIEVRDPVVAAFKMKGVKAGLHRVREFRFVNERSSRVKCWFSHYRAWRPWAVQFLLNCISCL